MEEIRFYGRPPFGVVCVHGGPGAPGSLAPLCALLAEELGIGAAEPLQRARSVSGLAEELSAQLARLGPPAVLVGHSWGAWLSLLCASAAPELVRGLALVGCAPLEPRYVPEISRRRRANLRGEDAERFDELIQILENGAPGNRGEALAELEALVKRSDNAHLIFSPPPLPADAEVYSAVWPEAAGLRASGALLEACKKVRCPILVLHGDRDPHPPEGVTEPLRSIGADFRAVIFPDCGHSPFLERAAQRNFLARLSDFLKNLC